jgi:O-antigen/teichoic acid export membrane protein
MSTIRRQSIISSGIVYVGFVLGFLNTYLFTRQNGGFSPTQYGLTEIFSSIANIMFSFAHLGMVSYIYKFFPYYKDNLPERENDMMSWAILTSLVGFIMVMFAGVVFKSLVIRKFDAHSADLVKYYYWIFPFGCGLTLYSLLETYAWQLRKSVLTNFFREILFRIFKMALILLFFTGILRSFDTFIKIYAFVYLLLAFSLLIWLRSQGKLYFPFTRSKVSRKFYSKIVSLAALAWSGGIVFNISTFFAQIVIAAVVPGGLAYVGVYTLAQYIASIIQAPQRGIISATIAPLSRAWKDKEYGKIHQIYRRSSINQLIFSVAVFILIWVNFTDGVFTFHLKTTYLDARFVFLFIGLTRIVDMGTGVNSQIIATSTFWRFDFLSGILLILLTLPLNYILAKEKGVVGPAIADLFTFAIYNGIRYLFLYRKFGMQPFTLKTLYTLLLGLGVYLICHFLLIGFHGLGGILFRSAVFIILYLAGIVGFNLSEDVLPLWATLTKRLGCNK